MRRNPAPASGSPSSAISPISIGARWRWKPRHPEVCACSSCCRVCASKCYSGRSVRELLSILLLLGSVPLFGASWKPIGPWFGNVFSLAVERSNPDHLYALACKDDSCNGSVWRSTDGGNWWTPAGKELTASDVVWIAVHPTVPGTLYVGTLSRPEEHPGIAKSTDGGSSWHWLFTDGDSAEGAGALANPPGRLCFGPGNPPSIWLPNVNLHSRSSDDGAHWTSFYVVVGDHEYSDANGFAFSSSDPNLVWAYGTSGDYLRKSVDGGATWARVTRRSYGFIGWCSPAFLIDPADPNRLLVGGGGSNGIVASTDGGETWLSLDDFPDTVTVQSLTADPSKFNTLYASTNDGIFKSTNGGRSWSKIGAGLPLDGEKNVVKSIVVDPRSSNVLWASVYNNGIYRSTDGGSTWRESDNGMSTAPVDGLWVGASGTVLAGTSAGSFRRDGADRWTRDDSIPDIDSLAEDPKNPQIVYGGGDRGLGDRTMGERAGAPPGTSIMRSRGSRSLGMDASSMRRRARTSTRVPTAVSTGNVRITACPRHRRSCSRAVPPVTCSPSSMDGGCGIRATEDRRGSR